MKMHNDDLKKITEIKQYLLDPPVSFKLNEYAITYLQNAAKILTAYINAKDETSYFESLAVQLKNKEIMQGELRSTLKVAGKKLSVLTSR